jgi:hypothetical protein
MLVNHISRIRESEALTHQVRSNNRVQTLRIQHHSTGHRIHQHFIALDVRKVFRNLRRNLVPQHHPVPLRIALRDNGDHLARPLLRNLKCKADQALYAVTREDGDFSRDFPGLAAVRASALAGVFALRIFAHNDPVEIAVRGFAEWGFGAAEDFGGAHVGVLLKGLADC